MEARRPAPSSALTSAAAPLPAPSSALTSAAASLPASSPVSATAAPSSSASPAPTLSSPALAAALAAAFLAGRKAGPAVRGRLGSCKLPSMTSAPASQSPHHLAGASFGHLPVPCSAVEAGQLNTCGREAEATGGWQLVKSRRGPRGPDLAAQAFRPPSIPSWLRGRCCRCLAPGHRAFVCRDPVRCARCLENGHRARGCCNKWRPLSSLACLAVPPPLPRPRPTAATVQDPAPRFGPGRGWPLPQLAHPQLPVSVGIGSMPCLDDFVVAPGAPERRAESAPLSMGQTELLRAELRDCIARVGSVLASAEAALAKLQDVPVVTLLPEIQVDSDDGEAGMYGDYSPRAASCLSSLPVVPIASGSEVVVEVLAPVLQIMPELQKLCGEPASPISIVHPMELGSLGGALVMTTATSPRSLEPSLSPAVVDCGGSDAAIALSSVAVGQAMSDVVGTLAPNSVALKSIRSPVFDREAMWASIDEAVFKRKLCGLLTSLEAASPGSGKAIACLLAEEDSTGKIMKVKKALRSIRKKSGAPGAAPATA